MINFFYKVFFFFPSILVLVLGAVANSLAAFSQMLGEICNEYFEVIYGESEEE